MTGIASGRPWEDVMRRASVAAALCVQWPGAQNAIPWAVEVDELIRG